MSAAINLSPIQQRVLLAMHPTRPSDVWRLAWNLSTIQELEGFKAIARGKRGWIDATLTETGQRLRAELERAAEETDEFVRFA